MLQIFNNEPLDWRDLQIKVGKIFKDIGYNTEIEKDIETARGIVNVDVFAEKVNCTPKETVICECKHWNNNVTKTIVHSFRTVISDYGANIGLIISKKGFQSGAYDACEKSNIQLMTFGEFQKNYRKIWLDSIIDTLYLVGYPLCRYSDFLESFYEKELNLLGKSKEKEFLQLCNKYRNISMISNRFLYKDVLTNELHLEDIDEIILRHSKEPGFGITVNCLSDYFYRIIQICESGVKVFDDFFGKPIRKR